MILGFGVDLAISSRLSSCYLRHGAKFLPKVLHPKETLEFQRLRALNSAKERHYLATRWAVKEALVKAIGQKGFAFRDVQLCQKDSGAPYLLLEGSAKAAVDHMKKDLDILVSVSHDGDYVIAGVILQKTDKII